MTLLCLRVELPGRYCYCGVLLKETNYDSDLILIGRSADASQSFLMIMGEGDIAGTERKTDDRGTNEGCLREVLLTIL